MQKKIIHLQKNNNKPQEQTSHLIRVQKRPGHQTEGLLHFQGRILRCALGRSSIGRKRGEGDGMTPRGRFSLLKVMARRQHIPFRHTPLGCSFITAHDGWCDETGDRNYNKKVPLPYPSSHEKLWRDDHLYDIAIVMDYNVKQHMGVGGSAIFFHLAHADYRPTEGCIALSRKDMLWLLPRLKRHTMMQIF